MDEHIHDNDNNNIVKKEGSDAPTDEDSDDVVNESDDVVNESDAEQITNLIVQQMDKEDYDHKY